MFTLYFNSFHSVGLQTSSSVLSKVQQHLRTLSKTFLVFVTLKWLTLYKCFQYLNSHFYLCWIGYKSTDPFHTCWCMFLCKKVYKPPTYRMLFLTQSVPSCLECTLTTITNASYTFWKSWMKTSCSQGHILHFILFYSFICYWPWLPYAKIIIISSHLHTRRN